MTGPDTPSREPIVRLPTWVNIVLVLILFASCGAADETRRAFTDDGATRDDVPADGRQGERGGGK